MRVCRIPLTPDVVVTLAHDQDGWRFESWALQLGIRSLPTPSPIAQARRFADLDRAVEFFRAILED
jgi:hypothetical protein